jgi:hypothetical protein
VGIPGAKPKTRAFVTERTWAHQTKSAFSDAGYIAEWTSPFNRSHHATSQRQGRTLVHLQERDIQVARRRGETDLSGHARVARGDEPARFSELPEGV